MLEDTYPRIKSITDLEILGDGSSQPSLMQL